MPNKVRSILQRKDRTEDVLLTEHCNFKTLSLKESVLHGLTEAGFYIPSPIQAKAIPLGRCGLDLIVQAKSGTGKTAVFTIISLEIVNTGIKELQVVVVAPTREIAFQIKEVMTTIGKYIKDLKVGCFIGGMPIEDDIKTAKDCHIAVGAPGRLTHLMKKGYLTTSSVKLLVLDEGDKLMESSFLKDINYMCTELPIHKQMIAVSATFSEELKKFLQAYMHRSTFITPKVEIPILLGLRQFFSEISSTENTLHKLKNKSQELDRLFNKIAFTQCMIFCNYESQINSIKNFLKGYGWDVMCISGSQSQGDRLKTLGSLKDFKCRILLSTDLTARGIDATNVDVVINFDVPVDANTYLHRMGRAGRYGCKGLCITITSNKKDKENLQKILGSIAGTQMSIAKLPVEDELLLDLFSCDLNKLPRLCGIINLNKVETDSCNVTKSILEVKNLYQKKLSESDIIPYEFERMCVEAIDENINKVEFNKSLKSKAAIQAIIDKKLDSAAANSNKPIISDKNKIKNATVLADSVQTANSIPSLDSLTQWTLVKETIVEDSTSDDYSSASSTKLNETLKNQEFQKQLNAHKNVTMFNLNKVMSNETKDVNAATESVTEYLKMKDVERKNNLKEMSNLFSSTNCQDILKNLAEKREEWRKLKASKVQINNKKDLIFKFGYDYLCKDGIHWINGLGDNYKPVQNKNTENVEHNEDVVEYVKKNNEVVVEYVEENNKDVVEHVAENNEDVVEYVQENNEDVVEYVEENNEDVIEYAEENNDDMVEYVEENNEEMLDDYGETNEFNIEEGMNEEQTVTAGTSNQEIPNKGSRNKSKKRQASEHNSNTYNDQHWNFCQGPDKIDDYKHYGQYYNYPIKRFLKSLSEPLDSQKSEEAFKLWLEGMSQVTKYLHRGIYWDLMYGGT